MQKIVKIDGDELAAAIIGASYLATHHRLYIDNDDDQEKKIEMEWLDRLNRLCEQARRIGVCVEWPQLQGRLLAVAEYESDHKLR